MPVTHPPLCDRCGRFLSEGSDETAAWCAACAEEPPPWRQVRAPFRYTAPTDEIIHRMKYEGLFALCRPLAELMALHWPSWAEPPDLIVPIALHPRRERRRGYNQAALLSGHLARVVGCEWDGQALQRVRHTAPQVGLNATERRENVQAAFRAAPERVAGRRILLIDDVFTTGATMTAAAQALLAAGAAGVSGYCLARAH